MKHYTLSEIKGKYIGETFIVEAKDAVDAMKKCGMICWIKGYKKFDKMYFGKMYEVYETNKPHIVEYICHV